MPDIRKEALVAVEKFKLRANLARVKKAALEIVAQYENQIAANDESSMGIDVGVPNVGDIVEYNGRRYHVDGWLRERLPPQRSRTIMNNIINDILYETQQEIHGKKLRFCYQEEATYLSLSGVAGNIAPVDEVKVVGKVNWAPEHIEEARQGALLLAEHGSDS